jgi:hypothetical protein
MKREKRRIYDYLRRLCLVSALTVGLVMTAGVSPGAAQEPVDPDAIAGNTAIVPQLSPFDTTVAYVVQFYPLWFTYYQSLLARPDSLAGPIRVSPIYHFAVAVNVDTLYASSFLDLTAEPAVVTIPGNTPPFPFTSYSILMLDPYGSLLPASASIPPKTPGIYALIGPGGFTGTLPAGVTPITLPLNYSTLAFRADKFSPTGENQIKQAEAFRRALKSQTLSDYLENPLGGATTILPEIFFSVPFKTTADDLIAHAPIAFLRQLQRAVESDKTPPFSPYEEALSNRFNSLFANRSVNRSEFSDGAQAAHELILDRYLTFTDWAAPTPTNWIHFTNIGDWGNHVVERSSITEFLQYANGIATAAYYHVFKDANGNPLDGTNPQGYVLTFTAEQPPPEATRFWSVTAYTPEAIELVPNPAHKYAVASYTPGLQPNSDGSLSIYMAQQLPAGVPMANWLPIPPGAFNIMLRVYGPEGTVEDNTYVPPGIQKR